MNAPPGILPPRPIKTSAPYRVLVIVGATASGKTDVSLRVARHLDGEIISADARQIYKYLDIGTAKPTPAQRDNVRHYFVDTLLPDEDFSAGAYGEQGRIILGQIASRGKVPIVVGGSGLYVRSLIDGFFEGPSADREYRASLNARVAAGETQALIDELRRVDPVTAARSDPTKPRRVIRALEVYHVTGRPLSEQQALRKIVIDFQPVLFGLAWERKELYERVDRRCEEMLAAGLADEVGRLIGMGYSGSLNALKSVGYAEVFAWKSGTIDADEMVRRFRQNSRRYAKRQLTWFRRDKRIHWVQMSGATDPETVAVEIVARFRNS